MTAVLSPGPYLLPEWRLRPFSARPRLLQPPDILGRSMVASNSSSWLGSGTNCRFIQYLITQSLNIEACPHVRRYTPPGIYITIVASELNRGGGAEHQLDRAAILLHGTARRSSGHKALNWIVDGGLACFQRWERCAMWIGTAFAKTESLPRSGERGSRPRVTA